VQAPEDLAAPPADIAMITRVLDNLIGNAFKYTRASGHIVLGAEQNGTTLFLSVADDGEGVPIAYAERIFDKFAQLTTKNGAPLGNGAGLGLAFCKLAVEAHGGCIWLDTAREKGSRFVFTLPLQMQPVI
jgi:signal transduction histidine kinase